MVTTVAAEIGTVMSATTTGPRVDGGGDESVFAQLLSGVVAAAPAPVVPVARAVNGKAVSARAADDTTQSAQSSAEMLALCGLAVTPPVPPPAVVVTDDLANAAADTSVETPETSVQPSAVNIDPAAVMNLPQTMPLQANTVVEQEITETDETAAFPGAATSSSLRAADLQWLTGGMRGAADSIATRGTAEANPATALQVVEQFAGQVAGRSEKHTNTDQTATLEASVLPDSTAQSPEQQPAFQKLMAQMTPMMGMVTSQLRESGFDESARDVVTDVATDDSQSAAVALNAASLQPAGTQLANDSPTLDISPRHHLQASVGTHQWATELGNKLTMMATQDTQSATLYMTPADLGPVQVRIDLHDDQASVWFTAEHAETRSALEQSLPKLREMFTAQGMSLTDAGVFGDRSRQQQADNSFTTARFQSSQYEDGDALADTAMVRSISLGLLDAYA